MRRFLLIGLTMLMGCTGGQPGVPDCGTMPDLSQLTRVQRMALEDTLRRTQDLCGERGRGCNFRLAPYQDGLSVIAQSAYDQISLKCAQMKGGNPVFLYDASGRFKDQLPGM